MRTSVERLSEGLEEYGKILIVRNHRRENHMLWYQIADKPVKVQCIADSPQL